MAALCLSFWAAQQSKTGWFWLENTLLALCTWLIYSLDHLQSDPFPKQRHLFHLHNRAYFYAGIVAALLLGAGVCSFVSVEILKFGAIAVLLVAAYVFLFSIKKINLGFIKEIAIAFIFSVGCWLIVWIKRDFDILFIPFLNSFLLVLCNLCLCEFLEKPTKKWLFLLCKLIFAYFFVSVIFNWDYTLFALISGFYIFLSNTDSLRLETKRIWADRAFLVLLLA